MIIGDLAIAACISVNCRSKIISRLPTPCLLRAAPRGIGVPEHSGSDGVHEGYRSQRSDAAPSTCPSAPSDPRRRHLTPEAFSDPSRSSHCFGALSKAPQHSAPSCLPLHFLCGRMAVTPAPTSQGGCADEVRYPWREPGTLPVCARR